MDKGILKYLYNGVLFSIKKEQTMDTTWMNLQNMLIERSQTQRFHIVWYHLYEIYWKENPCRKKAHQWLPRVGEWLQTSTGNVFQSGGNILKLITMMIYGINENTKNYCTGHLQ